MMFDFSFLYGGVRYCGHQLLWTEAGGDLVCRLQSLNITLRRARYGEGEEQCLWFENTGEEDSLPLEDICDADFLLPCPKTAESPIRPRRVARRSSARRGLTGAALNLRLFRTR